MDCRKYEIFGHWTSLGDLGELSVILGLLASVFVHVGASDGPMPLGHRLRAWLGSSGPSFGDVVDRFDPF